MTVNVSAGTVSLDINGLEDLGPNARYEGWLIVSGSPVSTGVFTVDAAGNLSQSVFDVCDEDANATTAYMISIEPFPDMDPNPSDSRLLAADLSGGIGNLNIGHSLAIGDDLTNSTGEFILINVTGDKGSEPENGIWYISSFVQPITAGLDLPELPSGWVYEGWVVDDSVDLPISTGTFADENAPDSDGAGPAAGLGLPFLFPGQEFINPPRDLSASHTAVISVEPVPDNSPAPFTLKPLVSPITGEAFNLQLMNNNALATNPFGQVNISSAGDPTINVQSVPTMDYWATLLLMLLSIWLGYTHLKKNKVN